MLGPPEIEEGSCLPKLELQLQIRNTKARVSASCENKWIDEYEGNLVDLAEKSDPSH